LGVLYCTSCCDNLSQSPSEKADEQAATDAVPDKVGRKVSLTVAEGVLWTSLFVSHLLFFTHLLSLPNSRWHIPHPDSYFKGLICLDFLTLFFLLASKRLSTSRFGFLWALLIASGFIILVAREIVSLIG
jgi:hypothetical protein